MDIWTNKSLIKPLLKFHKRLPIKDVRNQEGLSTVQCGYFADKGEFFFQMWTSALFGAKNFEFFKIYGVSTRTRGLSQCRHFADKEEGVIFSRFCEDVFYGRS